MAPHPVYLALGEGEEAGRAGYRDMFADEIPPAELTAIREATNGGFALGSGRFQRRIAGRPAHLARQVRTHEEMRPRQCPILLADLAGKSWSMPGFPFRFSVNLGDYSIAGCP